jgi:hypothetical protein
VYVTLWPCYAPAPSGLLDLDPMIWSVFPCDQIKGVRLDQTALIHPSFLVWQTSSLGPTGQGLLFFFLIFTPHIHCYLHPFCLFVCFLLG